MTMQSAETYCLNCGGIGTLTVSEDRLVCSHCGAEYRNEYLLNELQARRVEVETEIAWNRRRLDELNGERLAVLAGIVEIQARYDPLPFTEEMPRLTDKQGSALYKMNQGVDR